MNILKTFEQLPVKFCLDEKRLKIENMNLLSSSQRSCFIRDVETHKQQIILELQHQELQCLMTQADVLGDFLDSNSAPVSERMAQLPQWEKMVEQITELERVLQIPSGNLRMTITATGR